MDLARKLKASSNAAVRRVGGDALRELANRTQLTRIER
jgi:hypothetical protein